MDMEDVFLLEKNIWEDVFLLDKKIWIWQMCSCWRRIYEYERCLLVGKEYMIMEDALLLLLLLFMLV